MGSAELVPAGGQERLRIREGLILPVLFTAATWAVDRFTRSALGDWRYVPVALLGLCAIYFAVMAFVVITALGVMKSDGRERPRWSAHATKVGVAALIVVALFTEIVLAARDHSILDAVTALVIVVWTCLVPGVTPSADMPRIRRHTYRVASLLLPLWFFAVAVFRLR
jgi:cytochrome bd-type quinol oxidase subunit 2